MNNVPRRSRYYPNVNVSQRDIGDEEVLGIQFTVASVTVHCLDTIVSDTILEKGPTKVHGQEYGSMEYVFCRDKKLCENIKCV